MSRLNKLMLALFALTIMVTPAFADVGCRDGRFVGSYTTPQVINDIWGDSTGVNHTVLFQLNLQSDGTAFQYWTALPDTMLNSGTGSPFVGSWTCRNDGQLVVNLITAAYTPTLDVHGNPSPVDLILSFHQKISYLFKVTDGNTLTRTMARARRYGVTEDPSDPTAGTLRPLNTTLVVYRRLVASDSDLIAP